jgi:hypothetical protein
VIAGGGRKWEHLEVNKNGKVERPNIHVKKGDFVKVELNQAGRGLQRVGEKLWTSKAGTMILLPRLRG